MRNSKPNPVQSWQSPFDHALVSQNRTSSGQHKHQQPYSSTRPHRTYLCITALTATASLTGISSSRLWAVSKSPAETMPVITAFQEKLFLSGMERKRRSASAWSRELRWAVTREL
ncbi:hypothetical protein CFC21_065272 [Triticum aestivum]|uniref:Uncharacterized protein n=3 Tax=Triticum TaxID=4564 RepID=A0A9R0TLG0_TRITD|nr:hypothetical protein CFC21_065272 [Triticum aestivum]VAI16097.1 unnamed protein product [Triticum turgidum subsp. durum]